MAIKLLYLSSLLAGAASAFVPHSSLLLLPCHRQTTTTTTPRFAVTTTSREQPPSSSLSPKLQWWGTTHNDMQTLLRDYDPVEYPIVVLGQSFLAISSTGGSSWGEDIPVDLDNKLRDRPKWLPVVEVVCLGPDITTYYVQFTNGSYQWSGLSRSLSNFIDQNPTARVKVIALGPKESFFCLLDDGSVTWEKLPKKLHENLMERQKSMPAVDELNLGPNGEWFVRFQDGTWQCHVNTMGCDTTIDEIHNQGGSIYDIQFGHNWSWLIRNKANE